MEFQLTLPLWGWDNPLSVRSRVVLPLPFAPCIKSILPQLMLKERFANNVRSPRTHCKFLAVSTLFDANNPIDIQQT